MTEKYKMGSLYLVLKNNYHDGENPSDDGNIQRALILPDSAQEVMSRAMASLRLTLHDDNNSYITHISCTGFEDRCSILHAYTPEMSDEGIMLERHGDDNLVRHTAFEDFSYGIIEHKDQPDKDTTDFAPSDGQLFMDNRYPYPADAYDIGEHQSGLFKQILSGTNFFLLETYREKGMKL